MKKLRDKGPYIVDERNLGECNDNTQGIVMDCVTDLDKFKPRVKVMRTEKIKLLAGLSTVAVFKIRKADKDVDETGAVKSVMNELSRRLKGGHAVGHQR